MIINTLMRGGIIGSFQGVRACGSARKCIKTLFRRSKAPFVVTGPRDYDRSSSLPILRDFDMENCKVIRKTRRYFLKNYACSSVVNELNSLIQSHENTYLLIMS